MFSCEFCEISKNTFFTEPYRVTASKYRSANNLRNNLTKKQGTEAATDSALQKSFILLYSQESIKETTAQVYFLEYC